MTQPASPSPAPSPDKWTVQSLLAWTIGYFTRKNVDAPRLSAEMLLAHVLKLPRIQLYVQHERPMAPAELEQFRDLVRRAGEQEPVAYLVGSTSFYSLELEVTRDVLIPRPDTETLVETVLRHAKASSDLSAPRVCDLCTGSGAIAVVLAKQMKEARIVATDLSEKAADVARRNAEKLGVAERVSVVVGDLFAALAELPEGREPFDLVTANPPYVPTGAVAQLDRNVRDYEPHLALDGGPDGLDLIRRILSEAPEHLRPGGRLFMEMQFDQGPTVRELAEASGQWTNVQVLRDLAGHDRVLQATRI